MLTSRRTAPHGPLDWPAEYEAKYAHLNDKQRAKFYGMITNIDDNVGRLVAKLKEWDLERDTILIFMTDNGGTAGTKEYNAGMRGQKGTPWEGGSARAVLRAVWRSIPCG